MTKKKKSILYNFSVYAVHVPHQYLVELTDGICMGRATALQLANEYHLLCTIIALIYILREVVTGISSCLESWNPTVSSLCLPPFIHILSACPCHLSWNIPATINMWYIAPTNTEQVLFNKSCLSRTLLSLDNSRGLEPRLGWCPGYGWSSTCAVAQAMARPQALLLSILWLDTRLWLKPRLW